MNPIGQIFTPDFIAEFMVRNVSRFLNIEKENFHDIKVLEPSAGEGVFLKYLLKNSFSDICAFEMDLSLRDILLESFPSINFKFDNFLSSQEFGRFDLIIGNPPYLGQNYNAEVFQDYVKKYPICAKYFVGNMDLFYFFIHLGIEKLNPGGFLSFITTNYWITKSQKTGIKFLKPHILNECYLRQYIDLSSLTLFEGAKGQHNCIFVLQKKTEQEKIKHMDKEIQIIQINGDSEYLPQGEEKNMRIFIDLINDSKSKYMKNYFSALSNNDLSSSGSWNLIYPNEIKRVVDKIEKFCEVNERISLVQDYFIIRNGLILINDNIFILKEGEELKIENNSYYVLVKDKFLKLSELEKNRLKKVYKSRSIKPYGYENEHFIGYLIYFNKNEFYSQTPSKRNKSLERKYPSLSRYLKQYEIKLRQILINAKENPEDFYFPRRGSFIRRTEENKKELLIDLEPFYENSQKIFFKFISNKNLFGYTHDPYYATSDTYFLWPLKNKEIDYLFTLAYLNSKLVSFLFKAKNISIKRSKTKLEHELPLLNLGNFESPKKRAIVDLIKNLSFLLIINNENSSFQNKIQNTINKLFFELVDLNEIQIKSLLREYYFSPLN